MLELSEVEYRWSGWIYCVDRKVASGVEERCHVESFEFNGNCICLIRLGIVGNRRKSNT
jgi:hypothetical protein